MRRVNGIAIDERDATKGCARSGCFEPLLSSAHDVNMSESASLNNFINPELNSPGHVLL